MTLWGGLPSEARPQGERRMVDLTRIVPVRRAEGDADLPEPGQVQPDRRKRGMVDLTRIELVTS